MSKGKITMDLVIDQNDLDLWFTDESSLILQNTWSAPSWYKWMVQIIVINVQIKTEQ